MSDKHRKTNGSNSNNTSNNDMEISIVEERYNPARRSKRIAGQQPQLIDLDTDDDVIVEDVGDEVIQLNNTKRSLGPFRPITGQMQRELCRKLNVPFEEALVVIPRQEELQTLRPFRHREVNSDGNCFFRAISLAITGDEKYHLKIRKAIVVTLVEADQGTFLGSLLQDKEHTNGADYVRASKMARSATWASEQEIYAAVELLQVPIYTYTTWGNVWTWAAFTNKNIQNKRGIYLDHVNLEHYDVVVETKLKRKTKKPKADGNLSFVID